MTSVNLSLNGVSGTLWEIRRQENTHFYLGYRQAVLIVRDLQKKIKSANLERRKTLFFVEQEKAKANKLAGEEREILLDEISIIEDSLAEGLDFIRDAKNELNAAVAEIERLQNEHPDLLDSYETVQEKYSQASFVGKLARNLMISTYSLYKGVSESAAEVIVDSDCLTPHDQQTLVSSLAAKMEKLLPPEIEEKLIRQTAASMEIQNDTIPGRN